MGNLIEKSIPELHNLLKEKKISAKELVSENLRKIRESDLNCYISVFEEDALKIAEEIDKNGKFEHLLTGIPVAVKDNICVAGHPTTCASRILKDFVPPYDATAVERLKKCGAIIIGKTNLDEFAMGSSTEYSAFFRTLNPKDKERVPGGSSGGSAAAVAGGVAVCALGSDTGGSVRQPASFCGILGLKPTYGRVSRFGLVAFASSLDQIGPMGRTCEDIAILLNVISGKDVRDMTSADVEVPDYYKNLKKEGKGLKVGIPKEYFEGADERVLKVLEERIEDLKKRGVNVVEISLKYTEYAIPTYYLISSAEASSNLARYDGIRYGLRVEKGEIFELYCETRAKGFGKEVKRRIMLGTFGLQAGYYDEYYLKACKVRELIKRDFLKVFENVDFILTPTSPFPAFKFGEKLDDPIKMYLSDIYTVGVSLAGLPALSCPVGDVNGLPVGLQIIGKHFSEQKILNFAKFLLDR